MMCVFITAVPIIKLFAWGEELCTRSCSNKHAHRDSGGVCVYCCNTYYKAVREDLCVFITAVPITKLFAWGGGVNNGGHVLRETTSRG